MKYKCLLTPEIALFACVSISAQSLDDTKAYILRETPQAMGINEPPIKNGFVESTPGRLIYHSSYINPLDQMARTWLFPIQDIEVYMVEDSYGTHLRARARAGEISLKCYLGDKSIIKIPYANIITASDNPEKVRKLEKAFNHLIKLITGRNELF